MSMTDPIADMLTRIRNANRIAASAVDVPSSRLKRKVAAVLKREGYISNLEELGDGVRKVLRIYLKYNEADGSRLISEIRRESKPGRRTYKKWDEIPMVLGGLGIGVLSTPKGVLSDRECREQRVGGELICTVW